MIKVLLACSEPTVRNIFGEMVREFGYEPMLFDNGQAVWSAFENGTRVDLAIIDQFLPSMSCEQLLQRIGENPKLTGIPVIVMSSLPHFEDVNRLKDLGAQAVLNKPIRLAQFKEAIENALGLPSGDTE